MGTTKTREMEGILEYYRKLIKEKDKINQITEESLKNNRNILQKSERTNLELIKYLQNEKMKIKDQQEGIWIPSGKVYITQKELERPFVPHPAVHKHCNPRTIIGIDSKYLRKDGILTLEIPKYIGQKMRENYFRKIEIFKSQIPTRKDRKPRMRENNNETDWCENKFKKEMVLNYTERGKQQEQEKLFILYLLYYTFYYYLTISLLYYFINTTTTTFSTIATTTITIPTSIILYIFSLQVIYCIYNFYLTEYIFGT